VIIKEVIDFLRGHSKDNFISINMEYEATTRFNLTMREVEFICLSEGILPLRYSRNSKTFCIDEQLKFHQSHVTVIGCGGLGGYVIEQLVRLGIGKLRVVDNDMFEEQNLNRQLLSSLDLLGKSKALTARERALKINPAVVIEPLCIEFNQDNSSTILHGSHVVVDALDNMISRLLLAKECLKNKIPLVHGSIGGYYGQVSSQSPDCPSLINLFENRPNKGIESELGNPSFTPALIASLQVVETINLILNKKNNLSQRLLCIDLNEMAIRYLNL